MVNNNINSASPFHQGEQTLQKRTGKRDAMEKFGRRVIRNYLPDQHGVLGTSPPNVTLFAISHIAQCLSGHLNIYFL